MGKSRPKTSRNAATASASGKNGGAPSPRSQPLSRPKRENERHRLFSEQFTALFRRCVLFCACLYFSGKALVESDRFLPWGPAVEMETTPTFPFAEINASNDVLQFKHGRSRRIYERLTAEQSPQVKGPETVMFDASNNMYLMTEEAKLLQLSDFHDESENRTTAKVTFVRDLGCGRPLGGTFHGKSTLYIADAILGLTRIRNIHDPKSKLEVVVSSVDSASNSSKRLLYVDDVVVGRKTNKVYFTDASDIAPDRVGTRSWDTMYASKLDLLRGKATGSVYEYNPANEQVKLLVSGLRFANGISVDSEERFLVVAATFGPSVYKYHLQGVQAGQLEVLVPSSKLPGYPDGVDCVGTTCYVVLPSAIVPVHKLLLSLPSALDVFLRTLLLMLPPSLAPPVELYAAVLQVDALTGEIEIYQDPTGQDLNVLCGVTLHNRKLYFGSVHNEYIGVYQL